MTHEIKALTGLRWFAAIGVFMFHFGVPSWYPALLSNLQANGHLGVQFFFVLSGYVLSTRYHSESIGVSNYIVARIARIAPMYYFGLSLGLAMTLAKSEGFDFRLTVLHGLGLQGWIIEFDKALALNGPAWSVSVEIFFYALFPLISSFASRILTTCLRSLLFMIVGPLAVTIPVLIHAHQFGPLSGQTQELPNEFLWFAGIPLYFLGHFTTGIGAAHFARNQMNAPPSALLKVILNPTLLTLGFISLLVSVDFSTAQHPNFSILTQFSLAAIPVGILLAAFHIHPESPFGKLLSSAPMNFLGKVSYSFYVIHVPCVWFIRQTWSTIPYEALFSLVVGVSTVLYLAYEVPMQKRLIRWKVNHQRRGVSTK